MSSPAFKIVKPPGHPAPLVLDSPHSGTEYPEDFRTRVTLEQLRQAEDAFVDELYGAGPALGATLIAARFPRSYIDPNRSLLDIDAALLEGTWPGPAVPSAKTKKGIGLIWRLLDTGEPIYARKLSVDEVKQRIVRYHQPYQRAVKEALDETHQHFGAVWHLNLHSMPAVSTGISEEGPGKRRADFVLGDRDGTTCEPEFTALVAETLRSMGFKVMINDPYKGVELVRAFSDPKAARHSLQIEVNRRLYMDERSRAKIADFAALQARLQSLLEKVVAYASERSGHGHDHDPGHRHHAGCGHDPAHGHKHDHAHDHGHAHGHSADPSKHRH